MCLLYDTQVVSGESLSHMHVGRLW